MFTHLERIYDFLGVFCNLSLSFPISLYGLFNLTDGFWILLFFSKASSSIIDSLYVYVSLILIIGISFYLLYWGVSHEYSSGLVLYWCNQPLSNCFSTVSHIEEIHSRYSVKNLWLGNRQGLGGQPITIILLS